MYSVELVLDGAADRAVRADWATLLDAGLPSQGRHRGESNRPHLTLALTPSATEPVRDRLAGIAADLPRPATIGSVLVFGHRRYVLSRLVVPDAALLALQQRVVAALDEPVDRHGTFGAGSWTAHVTLGRRFTGDQVAAALAVLGAAAVPGSVSRLRLWDMSAHQEHWLG